MRRLLCVPIIHGQSDLGSLGPAIEEVSASLFGEGRWARHKETVASFWRAIEDYLASLDGENLKVYQDGLAAEGELGRKVVEEAARRGSVNHQIVLCLMNTGAEIRSTEDASLLLEEGQRLLIALQGSPATPNAQGHPPYARRGDRLTEERDKYVAERINDTLKEGETGVLFMGAYHDVLSHLAKDILVTSLKEPEKVRSYFQELLAGRDEERFVQLARYLASPVQGQPRAH